MLIFSNLKNRNAKKLARLILQKQDEEKHRISRDLHDDLGQELLYLKMSPEIKPNIDLILNKVRAISYNLSPVKITESSIKALLTELVMEAEKCNLLISYDIEDIFIKSTEIKINLYRIVQEALNNIIKHSKAENVTISLNKTGNYLLLEVKDNGIGIASPISKKSIGISSMKERAKIINAIISIEISNNGTIIKLTLKLQNN
jgi:signal transduction histidine kinase